jgi:hypothetical protein
MKRIIQIFIFVVTLTNVSLAQKLTASASKTRVAVGETFQISFVLNTNGSNFKPPALNDFDVYSGPNQSTSMSFVNGVMSHSITLSYIVAAKKEGKLTIGPASVTANGTTLQSNPMVIEAVKGSGNAGSPGNNQNQNQEPSAPTNENISENLFVRTNVSKTKVVQGEQITVSHKVYTRYQLRGFRDINLPDYNGFWAQDLPSNNQQIQVTTENIDGINYQVAELKRSYLFPQRSGKLQIEPMVADVVVRKQSSRRPRDIFEQFFGGGYEDASYSVKSPAVVIDVQPLPEAGKTSSFSGAVGDYSYKVELSKNSVKANEGINLIITLTGKGNIKLVDVPKIGFPEDFETYDPKTKENISVGANGVSGSKTFDFLIIPRHEGDYKLADLSFTFYNPVKKEYITIPSPELSVHVTKDDKENTEANVYTPTHKEDLKVLGNDIRYIKTSDLQLGNKNDYFFGSPLFYTGIIAPFLTFFIFLFLRRKNIELNKDEVAVKSRKANKMAQKRLVLAEQHLKSNNKELFYLEISHALYGYLADRFNISGADLNKEKISGILTARSVSEETKSKLFDTLNTCEFARYAPSSVSGDLHSIYLGTIGLITKIENEIK